MVVAALPDDVLAEVLRRLAPRSLAACRCVCKPWRDLVDDRRLLRADLLPRSLAGIFVNFHCLYSSEFFARPPSGGSGGATAISGNFDFLPPKDEYDQYRHHQVEDHCNGLLLIRFRDLVVNPATRWWDRLPPRPRPRDGMDRIYAAYLVFDPAASPRHYEVFLVPSFRWKSESEKAELDPMVEASEWPPESYTLPVFSSRTGLWQERSFIRQGQAAGTIADMRSDWASDQRNGVYWRGALYVHCQTNFVVRISLNDDKYQVIKSPEYSDCYLDFYLGRISLNDNKYQVIKPPEFSDNKYSDFYLGKSKKGVYLAFCIDQCLKVWILDETCSKMKWELKHDKDIRHILLGRNNRQGLGPWILQDINHQKNPYIYEYDNIIEAPNQKKVECEPNKEAALEKFEWISDDENVLDNEDRASVSSVMLILFPNPVYHVAAFSQIGISSPRWPMNCPTLGRQPAHYRGRVFVRSFDLESTSKLARTASLFASPPRRHLNLSIAWLDLPIDPCTTQRTVSSIDRLASTSASTGSIMVVALPDDVLAEVLRRLAPRCLAASRCVCKPARPRRRPPPVAAALRAEELLPCPLAGIFLNFFGLFNSEFFARRPSTGAAAAISGDLDFLPTSTTYGSREYQIQDHCNGLLLIEDAEYVANPATRWWARLPPCPPPREGMDYSYVPYLVFDPAMSPQHYEVLLIPSFRRKPGPNDYLYDKLRGEVDPVLEASTWPPASYAIPVFSSRTWLWQERSFAREGGEEAASTVAEMRSSWSSGQRMNAVYWRRALYVHCQTNFVTSTKYHIYEYDNIIEAPNQKKVECEPNKEAALEKFEWISDDENVLDNEDRVTGAYHGYIDIIGFHPYKEIIFLSESLKRGLAYHLSSSKVEDIGNLYPTSYNIHLINERFITASFPYTPCSM
uniref:F-box domain-containing protein n=1 Tax=Oryza glumipatula TaxID=40148 RepID=A0A0D9ZBB5_9ORYZ